MSTITTEQQAAIAAKVNGMTLPKGLGDEHAACSIAAINLALTGRLTDDIPDCMSPVVGKWIITAQDAMPDEMRNSARWKSLLPLAAGTGREHEKARLALIIDWMWGIVLPTLQPLADERGFGPQWRHMTTTERSATAAGAAGAAAMAARAAGEAAWAAMAARAAGEAAWAARAARAAGEAAWAAARAARAAGEAAWAAGAAGAAGAAAWAARARSGEEAGEAAWNRFDPCALLERLIAVGEQA